MSGATLSISDSWYLPQPDEIAEPYYQAYATAFPDSTPREPSSFMGVTARVHAMVGFGLYLYQRSLADELMVDTARAWLPRHADQWGVPQLQAGYAIGRVILTGAGTVPAGIELVGGDGTQWITTAGGTFGPDGTLTVPAKAELPGASGNVAAGTELTVISAVLGLQNGVGVVGAGGLAGGTPVESVAAWRGRIQQRIRKRGRAGAVYDYVDWAEANGAASDGGGVNVVESWVGAGSVGVIFALPNPAGPDRLVPSPAQVAAMQAAIDQVRPVTAQVIVLGAIPTPLPLTMALATDTVVNRANATSAAQAFIAANPIGGLLDHSRLEDAVLNATGSGVEISGAGRQCAAQPDADADDRRRHLGGLRVSRTAAQVLDGVTTLLPDGWAWDHDRASNTVRSFAPLADFAATFEGRAEAMLPESEPGTAAALLAAYERVLGPDTCMGDPSALTFDQRQRSAAARWTYAADVSIPGLIALAASYGAAITIAEVRRNCSGLLVAGTALCCHPEQFTWIVGLPATQVIPFTAGVSQAGDPLGKIVVNTAIECA